MRLGCNIALLYKKDQYNKKTKQKTETNQTTKQTVLL